MHLGSGDEMGQRYASEAMYAGSLGKAFRVFALCWLNLPLDPGTRGPQVDDGFRTPQRGVFAAGNLLRGAETADVSAGQAVYIPPRAVQFIENTGSGHLVFLCLVDPAWRPEDETVVRRAKR